MKTLYQKPDCGLFAIALGTIIATSLDVQQESSINNYSEWSGVWE